MVDIGDEVIVFPTATGELISIPYSNDTIYPEDQLLQIKLADGSIVNLGKSTDTIKEGDPVLTVPLANGEFASIKGKTYFCITKGFGRPVNPPGSRGTDVVDLGDFVYSWDGKGRVYVGPRCNAKPGTDQLGIDDILIVTSPNGTKKADYNVASHYNSVVPGPLLEITSLLYHGDTTLNFKIKDGVDAGGGGGGVGIGCCPLYIVRIID